MPATFTPTPPTLTVPPDITKHRADAVIVPSESDRARLHREAGIDEGLPSPSSRTASPTRLLTDSQVEGLATTA